MTAIVGSGPANISANSAGIGLQFLPPDSRTATYSGNVDKSLRLLATCAACCWAVALGLALLVVAGAATAAEGDALAGALPADVALQVQQFTRAAGERGASVGAGTVRVEVTLGALDSRLRLAPCSRVEPYLPPNSKPWGRTRVGLRCAEGRTHWNVFLPVTVHVFAPALVAQATLPAGTVLAAQDVREAEVDLAAEPGAALTRPAQAVGRTLARALAAGEALRQPDLKARQYFASGETVSLVAAGHGYAVQSEGQALSNGLEGQPVRVRTESGRIVSGLAAGEHRVEIPL
jgi:flagella basal body P-ring formation protein FlgA